MISDPIFNNISRHIELTVQEWDFFQSLIEQEQYPKGSLLLKQGRPCLSIYFVLSGALRAYYINAEGKDSTIMFALRDWWITDMNCFINNLPAILNIEAIDKCLLYKLPKTNLDTLLVEIPKFERFFRIIFQNAYIREQSRSIENLSLSARERYEHFLQKYPQISQQVPQKQIATYLGITPEFLSHLRRHKSSKSIS